MTTRRPSQPCWDGHEELAAVIAATLAAPIQRGEDQPRPRARRQGLSKLRRPMSNGKGRLAAFVPEIIAKWKAGASFKDLAKEYQCTPPSIRWMCRAHTR